MKKVRPKAVVVLSAHWESRTTDVIEINAAEKTDLIYEYATYRSSLSGMINGRGKKLISLLQFLWLSKALLRAQVPLNRLTIPCSKDC